jgi:murein DD-endopeptidase MepM/ murein hydrolase activator NlpD
VAKTEPAKPEKVAAAPANQPDPQETSGVSNQDKAAAGPEFRWPVRGRVISGFGAKGGNEGINIAVPEGTPVKAAEGGTVAYAGNELKGYGNLVLIRHDDGWVSAYAHNGEISVKRGDKVKRGQTIAKSGQTGNVSAPQLHFELRKGSTPVDPLPHLAGV